MGIINKEEGFRNRIEERKDLGIYLQIKESCEEAKMMKSQRVQLSDESDEANLGVSQWHKDIAKVEDKHFEDYVRRNV